MPKKIRSFRSGTIAITEGKKGDLLHPEWEDQIVLDELKFNIGSEAFEAQYQQQPVPPGGNMFKRDWLAYYHRLPEFTDENSVF